MASKGGAGNGEVSPHYDYPIYLNSVYSKTGYIDDKEALTEIQNETKDVQENGFVSQKHQQLYQELQKLRTSILTTRHTIDYYNQEKLDIIQRAGYGRELQNKLLQVQPLLDEIEKEKRLIQTLNNNTLTQPHNRVVDSRFQRVRYNRETGTIDVIQKVSQTEHSNSPNSVSYTNDGTDYTITHTEREK